MHRNLADDPEREHALNDPPDFIKKYALVLSLLTNALGFGGDKLTALLDRANKFSDGAEPAEINSPEAVEELYANIRTALGDDLDGYSVAVGVAFAFNLFGAFAYNEMMEKGAKHN